MILLSTPEHHIASCLQASLGNAASIIVADAGACLDSAYLRSILRDHDDPVLVNCIEYDDFDGAEYDRETAYGLNGTVPRILASLARESGRHLVHFSTVHVFDGSSARPYREDDEPMPVTVFGDSKLLGEMYCRESGACCTIVRIGDYFCPGVDPRDTIVGVMPGDDGFTVALRDQRITPLYLPALGAVLNAIARQPGPALIHAAPTGETTPSRFIAAWQSMHAADDPLAAVNHIREVAHDDFLWPAERPRNALLANEALQVITGIILPGWERGLAAMRAVESGPHRAE